MTATGETTPARPIAGIAWWPSALGLVAGIATALSGNLPSIVMVCATIYVLAAVTGRPHSAWIGFAASFPLIGLGVVLHNPWVSLASIGVATAVLIAVGLARGTWKTRPYRRQLIGMAVFAVIAVAAAAAAPLAAGIVLIIGLLGHAAWDVWHHLRRAVVARPYAEFCAVLDFVLAVVIAVTLIL